MQTSIIVQERPDVLGAIARAPLADSTKAQYSRAVSRYLDTGGNLFDAEGLAAYAEGLSQSGRAFLKAAVKLLSDQVAAQVKAAATPENVNAVAASLYRIEALQDAIQTKPQRGQKAHTWLSQAQVRGLLDTCGDDLKGQRDRLALGLLVAAGLRRSEAVNLRFSDVKLQPVKEQMRTVLEVQGKGAKSRVVPISNRLANALDGWAAIVGGDGRVLRSFDQRGDVQASLSPVGLFEIVRAANAGVCGEGESSEGGGESTGAMMRLSEAIDALLIATRAEGRSLRTVASYREKLSHLLAFLGDPRIDAVTTQDLRRWLAAIERVAERGGELQAAIDELDKIQNKIRGLQGTPHLNLGVHFRAIFGKILEEWRRLPGILKAQYTYYK